MLTHDDIWQAIDRVARQNGLSPSGLAKKAGLDPTTFNPSKRLTADCRRRWPSTESLSKILTATGTDIASFTAMIGGEPPIVATGGNRIPILGYAQAGENGYFDDAGYPVGDGWDEIVFPEVGDDQAYALEVSGDSMAPLYRDGDLIIVSPNASLRRGDRVVVRTVDGEVMAKELSRLSATRVELTSINPAHPPRSLRRDEVAWMARILWASQ